MACIIWHWEYRQVVKYCIQTPSCGWIEWSELLGNRIDSSSESNLNCIIYYIL